MQVYRESLDVVSGALNAGNIKPVKRSGCNELIVVTDRKNGYNGGFAPIRIYAFCMSDSANKLCPYYEAKNFGDCQFRS